MGWMNPIPSRSRGNQVVTISIGSLRCLAGRGGAFVVAHGTNNSVLAHGWTTRGANKTVFQHGPSQGFVADPTAAAPNGLEGEERDAGTQHEAEGDQERLNVFHDILHVFCHGRLLQPMAFLRWICTAMGAGFWCGMERLRPGRTNEAGKKGSQVPLLGKGMA